MTKTLSTIRASCRPLGAAPNNSFKPNLLRYTKHMAEKACHVFGSTTQVGLTQVLGRMELEAQPYRFKVSLRLVHPSADLSHCSREFGLEPSRQWRAGDARTTPRGRPLEGVRGESYWTAPLDTSPHKNIADSLSHIASWLKEHSAFMANHARSGGSVELFIGFFLESFNTGFDLSPGLLAEFGALGVGLDFDMYGQDDEPGAA